MTLRIAPPERTFPLIRHLSCRLSSALARSPVTPNQVTALSLVSGLAALWLFSRGGHSLNVMASLLFVVSYLLDNIDGEIARHKNLTSDFGEQFDSFVDWIVNAGFFLSLGFGVSAEQGNAIWLWLGLAGALGASINYGVGMVLSSPGEQEGGADHNYRGAAGAGLIDRLIFALRMLFRSDFCFIVLGLALVDGLWLLLPAGAIGAQVYWLTAFRARAQRYDI